ncbi:MAG: hypothetical protein NTX27_21775 [Verrucomicrobia bacterium]|nr:hypothetical protein [Verrucomicrobiota bacterium]
MEEPLPSYHQEFAQSPHHVVFGLLTLGLGFISAQILPLIIGVTAYALGWIYLPDLAFFRNWVDRRREHALREVELQKVAGFIQKRDALVDSLSPTRRERYQRLASVCGDIERAGADSPLAAATAADPRLKKLDELMWTFLRLLGIEESLERFLETERSEDVPTMLKEAEAECQRLNGELEALKKGGDAGAVETRQRYLGSRLERLDVLRKRQRRITQGQENLALVISEQDRLDQQIKLIRADAVATKNAESLTARIDATVEHLDQTNKWLSEMDEFKDLVGDLPSTELRVGYRSGATGAPPVLGPAQGVRPGAKSPPVRFST